MTVGSLVEWVKLEWHCVFLLGTVDVDHPEGRGVAVAAISIQEHFGLLNDGYTHIVEFTPYITVVIFYIEEVVATFCAAIVDAHCVQRIGTLFVFYRREGLVDFFT